jgi:predicted helicase
MIWRVRKYNLDDLYVRFLRIGERRITATGRGIVCYISNYSYIDDPSFVVARQRLSAEPVAAAHCRVTRYATVRVQPGKPS